MVSFKKKLFTSTPVACPSSMLCSIIHVYEPVTWILKRTTVNCCKQGRDNHYCGVLLIRLLFRCPTLPIIISQHRISKFLSGVLWYNMYLCRLEEHWTTDCSPCKSRFCFRPIDFLYCRSTPQWSVPLHHCQWEER